LGTWLPATSVIPILCKLCSQVTRLCKQLCLAHKGRPTTIAVLSEASRAALLANVPHLSVAHSSVPQGVLSALWHRQIIHSINPPPLPAAPSLHALRSNPRLRWRHTWPGHCHPSAATAAPSCSAEALPWTLRRWIWFRSAPQAASLYQVGSLTTRLAVLRVITQPVRV